MPATHPKHLTPISLAQTHITGGFWGARLETLRTVTINDVFDKFEKDGALENFDRVAQGLSGGHRGAPWFDGLVYETMRAAADFLAVYDDPILDRRLDGYIERIAAAQAKDLGGYLNTFVQLSRPDQRWGKDGSDQLWTHEEYNAGCMVEAAVHHYQATGKVNFLRLAVRFADTMCDYIGPAPKHNVVPSHSLAEEAFIKLYRLLRDEPKLSERLSLSGTPLRYLELVRFWMDNRGNHTGRVSFTEYAQDHRRLVEQPEAVGHSVRGTLLYAGLAALASETGEPSYYQTSRRLWEDVVERKMFITGGVGPIKEYEGFGYGYYLPSSGYIETCAGVGLAFWASQMNAAFGAAEYMDVYERVIYNNVLAGVSLEGTHYTYENPLHHQGHQHRWEWHGCPCCPPMLLKLYASLGSQIYAHDGTDIYVNLYISSRSEIPLQSGTVAVDMQTNYPWDGAVRLTLHPGTAQAFGLHLRLPEWCQEYRLRVNGEALPASPLADGYICVSRTWTEGDTLEFEMAMPVQRMVIHPFSNVVREQVAIQRGPLIYCLEGLDNPTLKTPTLPTDPKLESHFQPDFFGGMVTVSGMDADGVKITAVPYFAWDNRQPSSAEQDWMVVWLKQADWYALRQTLDGNDRKRWEHKLYLPLP